MGKSITTRTGGRNLELLDLVRGAGFLIVVLTHLVDFDGDMRARLLPQVPPVVDLFFLISGFVAGYGNDARLHSGARTVGEVIVRRIIRLFPLILLGTLLGSLIYFVPIAFNGDTARILPGLIVFIRQCLLIPTPGGTLAPHGFMATAFPFDGPIWFLFFDTLAYLGYLLFLRHLSLRWLMAIAAITGIGFWHLALTRNSLVPGSWYPDILPVAPRAFFDFTLGYILFRFYRPGQWKFGPLAAFLPLFILIAVLFLPIPQTWRYSGALQAAVVSVVMPPLLMMIVHIPVGAQMSKMARWSGRLSLAMYVVHFPLICAVYQYQASWHLNVIAQYPNGVAVLEGLVSLVIGFLAAIYFDEPIGAYLLSWVRRSRARLETISADPKELMS